MGALSPVSESEGKCSITEGLQLVAHVNMEVTEDFGGEGLAGDMAAGRPPTCGKGAG